MFTKALTGYAARRLVLAALGIALVAFTVTHLPWGADAVASPTAGPSQIAGGSSASLSPWASGTVATSAPSRPPTPRSTPTANLTRTPTATPRPSPISAVWQQDAALVAAKLEGRVTKDAQGRVVILDTAPAPRSYPPAASLDTSWTGLIQEPPRSGKDDRGVAYTDYNYVLFCGEGTAAVVLYYWPASKAFVTTTAGSFTEPVNIGANRYATTYWKATGPAGNARGAILYLATVEWPAPDKGLPWWPRPGLTNWSARPPSVEVANLTDGMNWEASGRSRLNYFYVQTAASDLTEKDLRDRIHADIAIGAPVVIAARTSDGTHRLPFWRTRSTKSAVNHFVTVVGYDDSAGTYLVMDTCGLTCNDRNMRAGVRSMDQAALFALIVAESDNDGIIW
jgi:hypothetical protein